MAITEQPVSVGEHTHEGWCARLRPRGAGRFFSAAFLSFWLCGWAVGEVVVAGILAIGGWNLLHGEPLRPGDAPPVPAGVLFVGAFLLLWLGFWTVGGLAAIRELFRLLWSEDRLIVTSATLRIEHRTGPVRTTREFPRDTLRRVYLQANSAALMAEVATGPVEITRLGRTQERAALLEDLRQQLSLPDNEESATHTITLPEDWEAIVDPEGGVALVQSVAIRRKQAKVAWFAAAALSLGALYFLGQSVRRPELWGVAVMASTAAAGLTWCACVLTWSRTEWRVGSGRITERRRFRSRVRDRFEAVALEITISKDGDGDRWYALEALAPDAGTALLPSNRLGRRRIATTLRDKTVPRRIGHWLAGHSGVPLRDQATDRAQNEELDRLLGELAQKGVLGRTVAGWIEGRRKARSQVR